MVTWTFDIVALFIGFAVGLLSGGLITLYAWMRDGGAWSKGFFDGCEKNALMSYLEHEKERMRDYTRSQKGVSGNDKAGNTRNVQRY